MKINEIFQLLSYIVAVISSVSALFSKLHGDKTIKEIELSKQAFAKENEELKRKQHLQDQRFNLLINFLGSINQFQAVITPANKQQALKAIGEVIPVCDSRQRQLVLKAKDAIDKIDLGWPDDASINSLKQTIREVTNEISSSSTQSN